MIASLPEHFERADAQLRRLEAYATDVRMLEQVLEQMPLPMIVGNGVDWMFVSRPFSDLLGWDRKSLGETDYRKIIHPDDLEATVAETMRVLETKDQGRVVNRYRINGTDRYRRLSWVWSPPGVDGYTVAVATDLGES